MLPLVDFVAARGYPGTRRKVHLQPDLIELPPSHATWGSAALFRILGDPEQLFLR